MNAPLVDPPTAARNGRSPALKARVRHDLAKYFSDKTGMYLRKGDTPVQLTNFVARIATTSERGSCRGVGVLFTYVSPW